MEKYCIFSVSASRYGAELVSVLKERFGGKPIPGSFLLRTSDQSLANQVISVMEDHGVDVRRPRTELGSMVYHVVWKRVYSEEDLDTSEYLTPQFRRDSLSASVEVEVVGQGLRLTEDPGSALWCKARGTESIYLAHESVKDIVDRERLLGVKFVPAGSAEAPREWWFLDSDVILPPVSTLMTAYRVGSSEPVLIGTDEPVVLADDPDCLDVQLCYERDAMQRAHADVARTYERRFASGPAARRLVVSQKFRRVLGAAGLNLGWTPVRLVES